MDWQLKIEALLADVRRKAEGGFTLAEIGELVTAFLYQAVALAVFLRNDGPDKKALVMDATARLFDLLAPSIPLPMFVQPFRSLLRPFARQAFLALVSGVIEAIYARLQSTLPLIPAK